MRATLFVLCVGLLVGVSPAADSLNVRLIGGYDVPDGFALGVAVGGGYAYVACGDSVPNGAQGLRVISVADPAQPVEVGYLKTPGNAYSVAVEGVFAYVVADRDGLRIISVADPANPVEVGYCDTYGLARDVAVDGDYAYVADGDSGGLRIISIADPGHPVEVGYCDTRYAFGVAVSGDYAYVAGDSLGVISVSDPAEPVEVGGCQLSLGTGVAVSGHYAYVTDMITRLRVVRVADPSHPVEVWRGDPSGAGWGVAVAGSHAYVASGTDGLRVISIADPAHPVEAGYYDVTQRFDGANGVTVIGDYAYVAYDWIGLQIFQFYGAGVEGTPHRPTGAAVANAATVVRGVLFIPGDRGRETGDRTELLDVSGRKVLDLHAGANDVSGLAPGVYFCRPTAGSASPAEPSAASLKPHAVRRVVVAE